MSERAPKVDVLTFINPGVATAVDDTFMLGEAPYAGTVTEVTFTADATLTGAATNHRALRLINRGQTGAGTAIVAELAFDNGINATAGDERAITLSGTPANLVLAEGDILALFSDSIGTGLADPGGLVQVKVSRT